MALMGCYPAFALSVVARYRNLLSAAASADDTLWCSVVQNTCGVNRVACFDAKYQLVAGHLVPLVSRLTPRQHRLAVQRIFRIIGPTSDPVCGWILVLFVALATALKMELGIPTFHSTTSG